MVQTKPLLRVLLQDLAQEALIAALGHVDLLVNHREDPPGSLLQEVDAHLPRGPASA